MSQKRAVCATGAGDIPVPSSSPAPSTIGARFTQVVTSTTTTTADKERSHPRELPTEQFVPQQWLIDNKYRGCGVYHKGTLTVVLDVTLEHFADKKCHEGIEHELSKTVISKLMGGELSEEPGRRMDGSVVIAAYLTSISNDSPFPFAVQCGFIKGSSLCSDGTKALFVALPNGASYFTKDAQLLTKPLDESDKRVLSTLPIIGFEHNFEALEASSNVTRDPTMVIIPSATILGRWYKEICAQGQPVMSGASKTDAYQMTPQSYDSFKSLVEADLRLIDRRVFKDEDVKFTLKLLTGNAMDTGLSIGEKITKAFQGQPGMEVMKMPFNITFTMEILMQTQYNKPK